MWHQQAYLELTHPRSLSLSKEAKILRCGVKALREGIGDHWKKLCRTVCLLESNQALGPGIGSELPNFQAGDHGSTEPALRPKSRGIQRLSVPGPPFLLYITSSLGLSYPLLPEVPAHLRTGLAWAFLESKVVVTLTKCFHTCRHIPIYSTR